MGVMHTSSAPLHHGVSYLAPRRGQQVEPADVSGSSGAPEGAVGGVASGSRRKNYIIFEQNDEDTLI